MRSWIYLAIFLGTTVPVMVLAYAATRTWSMEAGCDARGYSEDAYLAYCDNSLFGDYEHAAYYRRLEPGAIAGARRAEVLFLGNSRMQVAFSRPATDAFFAARHAAFHLLGFGYGEMAPFAFELLRRLELRPKVLVVNVDPFFEPLTSPAAGVAMRYSWKTDVDFALKSATQPLHRALCGRDPSPCPGGSVSTFRSRRTGQWTFSGGTAPAVSIPFATPAPVSDPAAINPKVEMANTLLAGSGVPPRCVILTQVSEPFADDTPIVEAIARRTGATAVVPRLSGLATFDGSHLDRASGDTWADAFFQAAAPAIDRCLAEGAVERPS